MRTVLRNAFPDLGSGRTDLYKAFAWRNWHLIRRATGRIGIVLPRTALQTKGSEHWRKAVLADGAFSDVTVLLNNGGWVFDDVHGQWTVVLCSIRKGKDRMDTVTLGGPYSGWSVYQTNKKTGSESVPVAEFVSWSDDASFPQLPAHPGALTLFRKLRAYPTLSGNQPSVAVRDDDVASGPSVRPTDRPTDRPSDRPWRVRPLQGDLNATTDKHRFILDGGKSARSRNSTPPPTSTGSSSTVASPPAPRTRRHQ